MLQKLQPRVKQIDQKPRSLEEHIQLASIASSFVRHDLWQLLLKDMDDYEASVIRELVRKGGPEDNEKRAMLFAIQVIRNFPLRLIEAGEAARRAQQEAAIKQSHIQLESLGQAYETLGPEVLGDPNF